MAKKTPKLLLALAAVSLLLLAGAARAAHGAQAGAADLRQVRDTVELFASYGDRSTGSAGAAKAADHIENAFREMGYEEVGRQNFQTTIRSYAKASLSDLAGGLTTPISPLEYNGISPETLPPDGLTGSLVYTGRGRLVDMNGFNIQDQILLMDFGTGKHWLNAAMLGASALVYVDWDESPKGFFEMKREKTPLDFPIFYVSAEAARALFPDLTQGEPALLSRSGHLKSEARWTQAGADNVYCYIQGSNKRLTEQLIVIEAFYDSSAFLPGRSPGADEASSIAGLLTMARHFKENPPGRSMLIVATGGHGQTLAGMREFVFAAKSKGTQIKALLRREKNRLNKARNVLEALSGDDPMAALSGRHEKAAREALENQLKNDIDTLTTRLVFLRLKNEPGLEPEIKRLTEERMALRRLSWAGLNAESSPGDREIILALVPKVIRDQQAILEDATTQYETISSAQTLRRLVVQHEVAAMISLHLSSHGNGVGGFSYGFMYDIRPDRNRNPCYSIISRMLDRAAEKVEAEMGTPGLYHDTLRPSRVRPWQTYFLDRPALGGEVSALGNYLGFTFASLSDARPFWGTPFDTPEKMDFENLATQARLITGLVDELAHEPEFLFDELPRLGISQLEGRALFIRQGELFPERPAPGTVIQAYQGPSMYHATVDTAGRFRLVGIADKKNTFHKVILEGYKFDPEDGRIIWAIDKNQTGKDSYRVKMNLRYMETTLVMFAARQITIFNLLEPRTFNYMTKLNLIDARRESEPVRYWYSRIDTRESTIASIFLEPNTPLKLTLSDNVMDRKLILTHGGPGIEEPEGEGYLPEKFPLIQATAHRAAVDMWSLLTPRVRNLETHGIHNERIRSLMDEGTAQQALAEEALKDKRYDEYLKYSRSSWALATRVYQDVEKTQKDVLLGVLFYIALFVPFAYCLERIIFAFASIHKRIVAFLALLMATIGVIYLVHPAFQLTYSPLVVILAFFIVGLSAMVAIIIFLRFEKEMQALQKRFQQVGGGEISRWRALTAAFVIGVSNLRRRKVRTVLTCLTLVILTFTIMSFTAVKSVRQTHAINFSDTAPYSGILMKSLAWTNMAPETMDIVENGFHEEASVAPRVWLENENRTAAVTVPVTGPGGEQLGQGLVGLSAAEPSVSDLEKTLVGGRWFTDDAEESVLLPARMAENIGINPADPAGATVTLWGMPYKVAGCFDGDAWMETPDLDGEPVTPVVFPSETVVELSEAEMDAMEGGEEMLAFQSRYQHIDADLVVVVPARTAMAIGGRLKAMAIKPGPEINVGDLASRLVDRFGLTLFVGEKEGTFIYHGADILNYSGVPNIIIPLIIAVLIVLNTMISSVYERKREIAVYTSVGMAPLHVSYLFIAEAVAFAVISVVFGYLLAQTAAGLLAGTPLWAGMTANYSSLAGVAAMLLVIGVTLLSVIYPSKVAGDIAIPDVNRSWTMPDSEGQELILTLPFLLKHPERGCVAGFLLDYYKAHQDVTHGLFCSDEISCDFSCPTPVAQEQNADECLILKSKIWLAPFDFGVKQRTELIFCPSKTDPQFLEIQVRISRESGEAGMWRRINKVFLNDIRKQLLIWRSLGTDDQRAYEQTLSDMLEEKEMAQAPDSIAGPNKSPNAAQSPNPENPA